MLKRIASWAFLFGAMAGGVLAVQHFGFDPNKIFLYFLAPYYVVCTAMQYIWPEQPNDYEPGEVVNDSLHNVALVAVSSAQNFLTHALIALTGSGLLFKYGVLPESMAAHNLPFWAQVAIAYLTFDFMFYVTHRMGHDIDFFWRMHSVHHSAHRLSVLNASRAHPIDLIWRRFVPIFVTFQTGVGQEAFLMSGVIGSVLATITHMNVRFSFGPLNYIIGTNEIHRWHHSNKIEEARNFSVFMLWDHLFGTFVYPPGRSRPEKMGLFNENFYPRHRYLGQLLIQLNWKRMKKQQAQLESQQVEAGAAAPASVAMPARTPSAAHQSTQDDTQVEPGKGSVPRPA